MACFVVMLLAVSWDGGTTVADGKPVFFLYSVVGCLAAGSRRTLAGMKLFVLNAIDQEAWGSLLGIGLLYLLAALCLAVMQDLYLYQIRSAPRRATTTCGARQWTMGGASVTGAGRELSARGPSTCFCVFSVCRAVTPATYLVLSPFYVRCSLLVNRLSLPSYLSSLLSRILSLSSCTLSPFSIRPPPLYRLPYLVALSCRVFSPIVSIQASFLSGPAQPPRVQPSRFVMAHWYRDDWYQESDGTAAVIKALRDHAKKLEDKLDYLGQQIDRMTTILMSLQCGITELKDWEPARSCSSTAPASPSRCRRTS